MVTTVTSYTDGRNRALPGEGYDGVVQVSVAGYYGTGVLLYDGRAVLTAAHLFSHGSTAASVQFETMAGSQTLTASQVSVLSSYDAINGNDDLALVWLSGSAPATADRYDLYRGSDEIGQTLTMVGYGVPGTGASGDLTSYSANPIRQKAGNQFDADAATLKDWLGSGMGWTPTAGTQLVADFDNGASAQDALGRLVNRPGTGLGQNEGLISPGDSGGPAFLNGQVAGIASYTASLSNGGVHPDIDSQTNSSYGEIAAWQRVSAYQQWIDQSARAHYPNAPTKPSEVRKVVAEGNSGISYAYFLVQFTGMRSDPAQKLSVDYATRDGTATAGQDYLPAHGTLVLYPNENQAVIPVEIVGDTTPEPDETFYLDVTNPVGGSFGDGVIKLTAMRTIVNDDVFPA
ncbi:sodium:calcium exchanger [Cupriavidus necator]|uniref:Sodium:calcium exchanger n=1 Tax=Cupriavidus necator TaxID=106590 RepID=A0A1U9UUL8_CUPNE|nr:Calx-beta domain-containing protein [Cupriavidus necator]AQV96388.1 sodium:calcium exchanger [Cupriavidus necator]